MKSILKITLPALVGFATLFTACQSEPEVGTKLYDKGETSNLPKLYIHDLGNQGNKGALEVVNANGELIAKKDTVKFYVRLSSPLDHDLEVSVSENPSATKQAGATALEKGAVNILTPTVTIAKGATVSADTVLPLAMVTVGVRMFIAPLSSTVTPDAALVAFGFSATLTSRLWSSGDDRRT